MRFIVVIFVKSVYTDYRLEKEKQLPGVFDTPDILNLHF